MSSEVKDANASSTGTSSISDWPSEQSLSRADETKTGPGGVVGGQKRTPYLVKLPPNDESKEKKKEKLGNRYFSKVLDRIRKNQLERLGSRREAKKGKDTMSIQSTTFDDFFAAQLANLLSEGKNTSLKHLDISDTNITIQGIRSLREALPKTDVRVLAIRHCNLDDDCLEELLLEAKSVSDTKGEQDKGKKLRALGPAALDLRFNQITDNGVLSLAKVLPADTNMKILLLTNNRISDFGRKTLVESLTEKSDKKAAGGGEDDDEKKQADDENASGRANDVVSSDDDRDGRNEEGDGSDTSPGTGED